MKKIFSFLTALFFMGNIMATTVTKTVAELASEKSFTNQTVCTPFNLDDVIAVSTSATDANTGKYYSSGNQIRLYQTGSATMTLTADEGYKISSITLTYVSYNTGILLEAESGVSVDFDDVQSATFTVGNSGAATNGQARITAFSVTYAASSGGDNPTLSAAPTTIDFGTVEQNAVVEDTSITVTFSDLTDVVTYSGLSSPFSASSTISNTGDKITIAVSTATVGNYSQTLTVQSAADSKSVDVTIKMNVIEPFNGQRLIFDLSENNLSLPTAKGSSAAGEYFYILNGVKYTFYATDIQGSADGGIYFGGTYTMIYPGNAIGLPAINNYKLVKVEATNSSTCSTSTEVSISSSNTTKTNVPGGEMQTWSTKGIMYTYDLSETVTNTMYYLWVANKNCQIVELILYYKEVSPATGLENIFENKAIKVIEDNKIVIKRNNIKYNILGQSL